ncbi:MAG: F0F1 ATP synthase subunit A [Muribaculaceae bacterium]
MKKVMFTLLVAVMALAASVPARAAVAAEEGEGFNPKEIIFHHLGDAYGWEVPFSHSHRIPLPVIVRDNEGEWHVFSSARVTSGGTCEGFYIAHEGEYANKVVGKDAQGNEYRPLDFSITKDVAALFISALVVMLLVFSVRSWYKKHGMRAPRKLTASIEFLVEFIYMGVIRPTMGSKSVKYAPYLLTAFFFIFVMNLLGLVVIFPGGANLTGNVAITLVMALCTFVITNVRGNKHYWKDIFWPDVPIWLKCPLPIMQAIEVFGMFTKPAALCVRLFANMMGGHMIVIVLTLLIFIFASFGPVVTGGITAFSVLFSLFMLLLDTLVSFIQAYVFTMLSTLFISMAVCDPHEAQHAEE